MEKRCKWRYYTIKGGKGYAVGWKKIGKYRFYFNSDKYAATGWKLINKEWYYFDARGRMLTNIWVDGSYLGADGKMVKNTVVDGIAIDGNGNPGHRKYAGQQRRCFRRRAAEKYLGIQRWKLVLLQLSGKACHRVSDH